MPKLVRKRRRADTPYSRNVERRLVVRIPRAQVGRLRRRNTRTAGFLGIEKKFYDKTYSGAIVATVASAEADPAANASCLNAIAQGDGESNRDGRRCVLKSVQIRGDIYDSGSQDGADPPGPAVIRVALVWDQQTNGAQLNSEDVFTGATNVEHAMINLQHSGRFRILWDKTFSFGSAVAFNDDGGATGATNRGGKIFKIYKNLNIPVTFDGTTEDIANITDNSLHMVAFASGTGYFLKYESRVRFVG